MTKTTTFQATFADATARVGAPSLAAVGALMLAVSYWNPPQMPLPQGAEFALMCLGLSGVMAAIWRKSYFTKVPTAAVRLWAEGAMLLCIGLAALMGHYGLAGGAGLVWFFVRDQFQPFFKSA